jgi:hypothetical protein
MLRLPGKPVALRPGGRQRFQDGVFGSGGIAQLKAGETHQVPAKSRQVSAIVECGAAHLRHEKLRGTFRGTRRVSFE